VTGEVYEACTGSRRSRCQQPPEAAAGSGRMENERTVGISKLGWTGKDIRATRMYVSPSSGDCAQWLDQNLPATVSGRSRFRWQHPKAIENANRHEPVGLNKSANGSRANRADEQNHGRASGAMKLHRRGRACHSLISLCVASAPPVKASLRLACSLRSQRSALTGPAPMQGIPEMREWQASFIPQEANRATIQQYSLTSAGLLMEATVCRQG